MGSEIEVSQPINLESKNFATMVAYIIGGSISPQRITTLIDASNSHGYIFHGIKTASKLSDIETQGILPLTPEGAFVSFWSIGERLFGSLDQKNNLSTYDTTFFHYAHANRLDEPESPPSMNIAISKIELADPQQKIRPNNHLLIPRPVKREDIVLAHAQGAHNDNLKSVQIQMFELLEHIVLGGFEAGTTKCSLR